MRVCAIELPARWDDRASALADVERALSAGPPLDIALLPEASLDGYVSPAGEFDLTRFAEPANGTASQALSGLARRHGVTLVGPVIERHGEQVYNALSAFGPDGARVAHYRKRHPWYPERWATPGEAAPPVFEVAGARVTLAICFDLHFLADDAGRALHEADALLFASAWVDDDGDARATLLPELARAFDVAVVNANWGPGAPRVPGQGASRIVDRDGTVLAQSAPGPAHAADLLPRRVDARLLRRAASVPRPPTGR